MRVAVALHQRLAFREFHGQLVVSRGNFRDLVQPRFDALVLELRSGAQLKLEPWDGDIFTARLEQNGRFAPVAENLGPRPIGFMQFQMDNEGKLNLLRLSFADGQAYEFLRE